MICSKKGVLNLIKMSKIGDGPAIFNALELRSGTRFRSLKHHKFTAEEIFFVCVTIDQLARWGVSPSVTNFCLVYDVDPLLVHKWLLFHRKHATRGDFCKHFCELD